MTFNEISKRHDEEEKQRLQWAESYCHDQVGNEVFAFHSGLSCSIPMKDKSQFIRVLAGVIWHERQRIIKALRETLAQVLE